MANKLPTVLSQAWWKSNKPKTLKSTGFGALMGAWEKAVALPNSKANFATMTTAMAKLEPGRKTALGMCNSKLHGDGIEKLKAYQALITKADADLKKRIAVYDTAVKDWHKKRSDCLAGMKKQEKVVDALDGKVEATLKQGIQTRADGPNAPKTLKLIQLMLAETKKVRADTQAVMDTVRIAGVGASSVDAADRDPKDFTASIQIQQMLEGQHNNWESKLATAAKKFGG